MGVDSNGSTTSQKGMGVVKVEKTGFKACIMSMPTTVPIGKEAQWPLKAANVSEARTGHTVPTQGNALFIEPFSQVLSGVLVCMRLGSWIILAI